jgi:hypothetical protein
MEGGSRKAGGGSQSGPSNFRERAAMHKRRGRVQRELDAWAAKYIKKEKCFICGEWFWKTAGWREDYCPKHENDIPETLCSSPKDWATILERREKGWG